MPEAPIVIVAWPALPPALAWMTAVPVPLDGAVYRPVLLIDPRPLTFDQVKLGCVGQGLAELVERLGRELLLGSVRPGSPSTA